MGSGNRSKRVPAGAAFLCALLWAGSVLPGRALEAPFTEGEFMGRMTGAGATPGMVATACGLLGDMRAQGLNVRRAGPSPCAPAGRAPAGPSPAAMLSNPSVLALVGALSKSLQGGSDQDIIITIGRRGSRPVAFTLEGSGREARRQQQEQQPRRGGKSQLPLLPPVANQVAP